MHRQASLDDYSGDTSGDESSNSLVEKDSPPESPPHPHNVLTRKDTDAALAMKGMHHYGMLTRTEGTWCFWSPEMCEGSQAFSGYAADMWAAGVCLYIFVTGLLPFYSEVPTELFELISEAKISYDCFGLSNSLVDLLKKCLEKDPAKRAGVGDCLQHPFLQVAREKRVRQLCDEFEKSRKRTIVLSEKDIKMAFRLVTKVPEKIILSATKRIHSGARILQEGFSEARERLSLGLSTPSGHSSFAEGHHNESGGAREGFFRGKFSSSAHSSSGDSGGNAQQLRVGFFHRRSSHESEEEDNKGDTATNTRPLKAVEFTTKEVEVGDVVTVRKNRLSSGVSSFGSSFGDELQAIPSEDDERLGADDMDQDADDLESAPSGNKHVEDDAVVAMELDVEPIVRDSEKAATLFPSPERAPSKGAIDDGMKKRRKGKEKCIIQ